MRRFIFFILILLSIGATACLLILGIPGGVLDAPSLTSYQYIEVVFNMIKDGSWPWSSFNPTILFTYGYALFLFINAVLLLSLLVMALTTLFRFSKIYRFYSTVWWYLFAAIVFTGVNVYVVIDTGVNPLDFIKEFWQFCIPLASAIVLIIVGLILKKTERNV